MTHDPDSNAEGKAKRKGKSGKRLSNSAKAGLIGGAAIGSAALAAALLYAGKRRGQGRDRDEKPSGTPAPEQATD